MTKPVTLLAPIKLAEGKTEADLLAASRQFQEDFVAKQAGLLRRELIHIRDREYLDIIQFRSEEDAKDVIEKEKQSPACHAFFSVMDMSAESADAAESIEFYPSLVTYV